MISKRLKTICSFVHPYKVIADIGCDHGYLIKEAIDKYGITEAYAIDNKKGPLDSAKNNLKDYDNVKFFLSDGLDSIDEKIEVVVIAGMGGLLIKDIISKNIHKISNVKRFVLQANKNEYELRKFMVENNYYIEDETIILDDGKYYEIIVFEKGNKEYRNDELFFGPKLLEEKNDVFLEKWTGIYEKLDKIVVFHDEEDKNEILKGIKRAICK